MFIGTRHMLSTPSLGITRVLDVPWGAADPRLSTPSLGITRSSAKWWLRSPGRELSTPSLGITIVKSRATANPYAPFQLPLSGSHETFRKIANMTGDWYFQLPLSGSQIRLRDQGREHREAFNSLSRDHERPADRIIFRSHRGFTFNSLSRDHPFSRPPHVAGILRISFNSLSRDHGDAATVVL